MGEASRPSVGSGSDELRASDADRDRTAQVLRDAAAEGRLTMTELDERLDQTYAAKTYVELARVTADLPQAVPPGGRSTRGAELARPGPPDINAVLSGHKVTGRWLAPSRMTARSVLSSVLIDFTDATVPAEVVIDVQVLLGEVTLIVPDDIAMDLEHGTTIGGERKNKTTSRHEPGMPIVRVRGSVVFGTLQARPPRRRWFRR